MEHGNPATAFNIYYLTFKNALLQISRSFNALLKAYSICRNSLIEICTGTFAEISGAESFGERNRITGVVFSATKFRISFEEHSNVSLAITPNFQDEYGLTSRYLSEKTFGYS